MTNPAAARTRTATLKHVCATFRKSGWDVELRETGSAEDAEAFGREAASEAVDVVAVYGGDGTVIQVVNGMGGSEIPVGLIPGGTGNVLAGNLRLPRSPVRAAEVVIRGSPKSVDLGFLASDHTEHHFAVACGAGFDAALMAGTNSDLKRRWGIGAYVASAYRGLRNISCLPFSVSIDGRQLELEAASLVVANCGEIVPPLLSLRDGISPFDGMLDLIALKADTFLESAAVVLKLLVMRKGTPAGVQHFRGKEIEVTCEEVVQVEADGELTGHTPFKAEVLPGRLKVMVPSS